MKINFVIVFLVSALSLVSTLAQAHESCAINSNPDSPGYGKLFCSVFDDGGAAVNPVTRRVSCGRGACAVNISPTSPGFHRVFCSSFSGGGAAVNARTGKVSCGKGKCYYASNGWVYCYDPAIGDYELGTVENCEEGSIDNCYEAHQ